jgi:two-component system response regulator YesN
MIQTIAMIDALERLIAPSAFAVAQACQVAVSLILDVDGCPDFDALVALFRSIPPPCNDGDALATVALSYRFLLRAGVEIHQRLHAYDNLLDKCAFDPSRAAAWTTIDRADLPGWSPAAAIEAWAAAYVRALRLHHHAGLTERAKTYARMRVSQSWNTSEMAAYLGRSVPAVHRQFKRDTGFSIRAYVTRLRVESAIELLRRTPWKVEAVAREVGWQSRKDLYRALHRVAGMTPTEVRKLAESETAVLRASLSTGDRYRLRPRRVREMSKEHPVDRGV